MVQVKAKKVIKLIDTVHLGHTLSLIKADHLMLLQEQLYKHILHGKYCLDNLVEYYIIVLMDSFQ